MGQLKEHSNAHNAIGSVSDVEMMNTPVKDPILDSLVWSDVEYRLSEFVDRFTLPQLVKVQEGFYGPDEDSCIGAEQILTLHAIKTTEKVLTRDRKSKEIHVPLNCSQKVELRPQLFRGVYETVEDLVQFKFVRVTQGFYSLEDERSSISPGDKLEYIRVEKGLGDKEDYALFQNQDRTPIRLPVSARAGFQPLIDGREYYLKELSAMKLPIFFQFVEPPQPANHYRAENVFNSSLGVLKMEKAYQDSSVICTTKEGQMRTVVTCPKTLPITVAVAQGALVGDKEYVKLCRFFHERVNLNKIDHMETENIYASRSTIREYEYIDWSPAPPLPPRSSSSDDQASPLIKKKDPVSALSLQKPRANTTGSLNITTTTSSPQENPVRDTGNASSDESNEYEYISDTEVFPPPPAPPLVEAASAEAGSESAGTEGGEHSGDGHSTGITTSFRSPAVSDGEDNNNQVSQDHVGEHSGPTPEDKQELSSVPSPIYQTPKKKKNGASKLQEQGSGQAEVETAPPPVKPKPAKPRVNLEIPADLSSLTVREVCGFLAAVHLEQFADVFAEMQIDGELLMDMKAEDMKALNMNAFQTKKLLKLMSGWRPRV